MSSGIRGSRFLPSAIALALGLTASAVAAQGDISALDQHFNQPGREISPWMFVPQGEHQGILDRRASGPGDDLRGGPRAGRQGDSEGPDPRSATTACPGNSRRRWCRASI